MMRYVAIQEPRAWTSDQYDYQERPSITVWEQDREPIRTGLLDAHGTPIFRVEDRPPMGFQAQTKMPPAGS